MGIFQSFDPLFYVHGMFFGYDTDARRNKNIVSDGNFSAVHEPAIDIQEKIISH